MSTPNTEFAAKVPENYQRYLVPLIFEDYARDLASRIPVTKTAQVLETACGTGVVTRHLAAALNGGSRLVATDLSPQMLTIAQATRASGPGLEYREADATRLPFENGSFDAVVCQFGVMFFPDKIEGYTEAARVLKPGGTFVFNVWTSLKSNRLAGFVHEQMLKLYPDDPPMFMSLPFGYYDVDAIKAELRQAGFADVESVVLDGESRAPSARAVSLGLVAGSPLAMRLNEMGVLDRTVDAVTDALTASYGSGPISAPMQSIAFTARKA